MDAELIRTIAEYVGYAAVAAAVIPHPNAKTAGMVLKGLRTILDLMAANTGQAKNAENPIAIKDAPRVIKDAINRMPKHKHRNRKGR